MARSEGVMLAQTISRGSGAGRVRSSFGLAACAAWTAVCYDGSIRLVNVKQGGMLTALDIFSKVTNAVPVLLNFVLRFFFTRSSASLNCLSRYSNASNFDPNQRGRIVGRARCGTTSFGCVECPPSGSVSVKTPPVLSGSYSSTVLGLPTKPVQDSSNFKSARVRLS